MSHEHESPTPKNISSEDRFDHSGKRGFEKPVREFDNTTLEEAHDMGLIDTPESPAGLPQEKNRKPLIIGGSALAAALIAGGAWLGLSGGDNTDTEPKANTTTSAPATPGETQATPETEAPTKESQPSAQEISAERYTTPEAVVEAYVEQNVNWYADGSILSNTDEMHATNMSRPDFATQLARRGDVPYISALFVKDWQDHSRLAQAIEAERGLHQEALDVYLFTSDSGNSKDVEPYRRWFKFTKVDILSQSDNQFTASVEFADFDNSDKNRAMTYLPKPVSEQAGGQIITWTKVDGAWKVSDLVPNGKTTQ